MEVVPLEIRLMGSLIVRCDGRPIHLKTRKTEALLALLALRSPHPLRRDLLIEMLWPDALIASGRNRLNLALTNLRQTLEPVESKESAKPTEPTEPKRRTDPSILGTNRHTVHLISGSFTTDRIAFETLLQRTRTAEDESLQIELLTEAVSLYRGELLSDFDDLWIMGDRKILADAYQQALRRLVKLLVKNRRLERAIAYARRAVETDPLREEGHRTLMRLYAALGRPAEVLAQYRDIEERLREAGFSPSQQLQQLLIQLSETPLLPDSSRASLFLPSHSEPSAAILDANRNAHPSDAMPPMPTFPSCPMYGNSFVGRHAELKQAQTLLLAPDVRLVTITGLGGVGKTRLATHVGQSLVEAFQGRVWFVSLLSIANLPTLWESIAQTLGLPVDHSQNPEQKVLAELRRARGLLILDNCEQILETVSPWIAHLLASAPPLTCLVTSRRRLNLSCEFELPLEPLPLPVLPVLPVLPIFSVLPTEPTLSTLSTLLGASEGDARLLDIPSVQLFIQRAKQARPSFALNATTLPDLVTLCQQLDGLPLAIELAAAWTHTLSLNQIQSKLAHRFSFLVAQHTDIPARHRSLRAVLDATFELLPASVQRFFALLSVFRGGWTLEAAESICGEAEALECLAQLREHSLIIVEQVGEDVRYRWLETLREYAEEKLGDHHLCVRQQVATEQAINLQINPETNLVTELERKHGLFYIRYAESLRAEMRGDRIPQVLARFDMEAGNFEKALEWTEREPHAMTELANALASYWLIRGRTRQGLQWFNRLLRYHDLLAYEERRCVHGNLANYAYLHGDYTEARHHFQQLYQLASTERNTLNVAQALCSLGAVALEIGDFEEARCRIDASLALWNDLPCDHNYAVALSHRAMLAYEEGEMARSRDLYRRSLELFETEGRLQNMALTMANLAEVLMRMGQISDAESLLDESLTLCRQSRTPRYLHQTLARMAKCASLRADFRLATELIGQAIHTAEATQLIVRKKTKNEIDGLIDALRGELGSPHFERAFLAGKKLVERLF